MISAPFHIEKLDPKKHNRGNFDSGNEILNSWFISQAGQQMRNHATVIYVAIETETGVVAGFYTLAASSVKGTCFDETTARRLKLPRYPMVPVILLGRLAIRKNFQSRGLGKAMLADALIKTKNLAADIGAVALVVDAKDDSVKKFYKSRGFICFESDPRRLFYPVNSLKNL